MADNTSWQDSPFTALRQHWSENAVREAANPPADKPTHEFMMEHGRPMDTAPLNETVWIIENGSVGVFLASATGSKAIGEDRLLWFAQDAGDLWPSKPTKWFPRGNATKSTS